MISVPIFIPSKQLSYCIFQVLGLAASGLMNLIIPPPANIPATFLTSSTQAARYDTRNGGVYEDDENAARRGQVVDDGVIMGQQELTRPGDIEARGKRKLE